MGQSTGSGSAGSEAGHSGTAGRLFSRKHESSPRQRRELPALLHPGRVPQRRHLELPVPTLEPLPTPLALRRNRRTTRPHQTQPRRGRRLLEQPLSHQSNRCPNSQSREPDRTPFELLESRTRSSVQAVPLFYPNNSELLHKLQSDSNHLFDLRCRARILILRWYFYLDNVVLHCVNN